MRLAIIARCDNTGLGHQTLELTKMLNPDKVILIDSTSFKGLEQYPDRYRGFTGISVSGFITDSMAEQITKNFDIIISCETFYNDNFIKIAKKNNCKTVLQYNYELFPELYARNMELPDVLIAPSLWNFNNVKEVVRNRSRLVHLAPPTSESAFLKNIEYNKSMNHNRLLHIHGTGAAFDRNGTEALLYSLRYSRADFELVIKTQAGFDYKIEDSRVTIDSNNIDNSSDLYHGFDALIMPRRYGGLCLPMNEALLSGMPVIMPNIDPNNKILPKDWLIGVSGVSQVKTKVSVNAYRPNLSSLGAGIDRYVKIKNKEGAKSLAYDIGYNNFSPQVLKDKYLQLLKSI